MTWSDPIVDEVRRARDAYAARFNYDLRAIYRDLKEQEKRSGRKLVSYAKDATGSEPNPLMASLVNKRTPKYEGFLPSFRVARGSLLTLPRLLHRRRSICGRPHEAAPNTLAGSGIPTVARSRHCGGV